MNCSLKSKNCINGTKNQSLYSERAKRELELQAGIKAKVEIPLTDQKNTQPKETIKSSLGAKGESVVPHTLLDAHAFSTPIREVLQLE